MFSFNLRTSTNYAINARMNGTFFRKRYFDILFQNLNIVIKRYHREVFVWLYLAPENLAESDTVIIPSIVVKIRFVSLYGIITDNCPPTIRERGIRNISDQESLRIIHRITASNSNDYSFKKHFFKELSCSWIYLLHIWFYVIFLYLRRTSFIIAKCYISKIYHCKAL